VESEVYSHEIGVQGGRYFSGVGKRLKNDPGGEKEVKMRQSAEKPDTHPNDPAPGGDYIDNEEGSCSTKKKNSEKKYGVGQGLRKIKFKTLKTDGRDHREKSSGQKVIYKIQKIYAKKKKKKLDTKGP